MKPEKARALFKEIYTAAGGPVKLAEQVGVKYITLYKIGNIRGFADNEYRKPTLIPKILHQVEKNRKVSGCKKTYTVSQLLQASTALKKEAKGEK